MNFKKKIREFVLLEKSTPRKIIERNILFRIFIRQEILQDTIFVGETECAAADEYFF